MLCRSAVPAQVWETVEIPQLQLVLWTRSLTCLCVQRQMLVVRTQKTAKVPQLQYLVDVLAGAVHPRFSRPCDHAATGWTVEVPQIQLSLATVDIPVVQQRRVLDLAVMAAMKGFMGVGGLFRRY